MHALDAMPLAAQVAVGSEHTHCDDVSAAAAGRSESAPPGPHTRTLPVAAAPTEPAAQAAQVASAPTPLTYELGAEQKLQVLWPRAPAVVVPAGHGAHTSSGPAGGAVENVSAGQGTQVRKGEPAAVPFW